jgi:fibronectin type 3 domain-containing protein
VTPAANPAAPGAPTNVTATGGNTQATVSFSAPSSDGGSPITSYTVTSSPGGLSASGTSSPIVVGSLANGTAYTFTVTATNAIGTGLASSPSNSVTPSAAATVPSAPSLQVQPAQGRGNQLTWTVPANGGSAITGYRAYRASGSDTSKCPTTLLTSLGTVTSYKDTATTRGQSYVYCVTAVNGVGEGQPSAPLSAVAQ